METLSTSPTAFLVILVEDLLRTPTSEYVDLVLSLSQLEFDVMTVHVPQYEALPPEELPTRITQLLKEQETRKRQCVGSDQQPGDSLATFQSRLLQL
ncbi:hypothetical protein PR002_g28432 [Phytophthora rubi]|uniref:Uncharacterized protein n=1 Tax=Phytophthora rubi TaxID=129364 RepID=A0A6A3HB64_9STRA|nr:hypothetical protein PR002_g28432 [Phytophthora rubi]